jgi:signal peptidase I
MLAIILLKEYFRADAVGPSHRYPKRVQKIMSFSSYDPQNPDASSDESDFSDPDSFDNITEPVYLDDDAPLSEQTPLPAFDQGGEKPLKPLSDTLPQLEAILRNEAPPPPPKHAYHISSAEPDWSDYTLPPLEDDWLPEPEDSHAAWKTAWAVVREIGETVLLTLVIFFLIQTVIRNFRVVGTSMTDNLQNGQYLIIDKLSYSQLFRETFGWSDPRHGDVIVFEPPNRPDEDYVKRIVGLPGETIEIKEGKVWINGQPLAEPFQPKTVSYAVPPLVVPEGQVYVLGDNRNNSNDSHNWGPLPIENIVGRAWLSYWPPSLWGTIPRDAPTEEATLKHFLNELVPTVNAENE